MAAPQRRARMRKGLSVTPAMGARTILPSSFIPKNSIAPQFNGIRSLYQAICLLTARLHHIMNTACLYLTKMVGFSIFCLVDQVRKAAIYVSSHLHKRKVRHQGRPEDCRRTGMPACLASYDFQGGAHTD